VKTKPFKVTFFQPFDFQAGQRINIQSGPRKGDWEVVAVSEGKVRLRCPVSGKEFSWNRFCYQVAEKEMEHWPTS
jgi:hypothetical protein